MALPVGYHCPPGLFDALEDAQTWVEQAMERLAPHVAQEADGETTGAREDTDADTGTEHTVR